MYPRVLIRLDHLLENVKTMKALCAEYGITITGVTKVFCGEPRIAQVYLDGGIERLGDSRMLNLKRMEELKAEKWLIRPPMLSEIEALVQYADACLVSEWNVIKTIDREAKKQNKIHKVILMADLGDLREGYVDYDELFNVALKAEALENVELYGIGTNLTCFSFVQPDTEKLSQLVELRQKIEQVLHRKLALISGGNSATLRLMLNGGIPEGVDTLRLGESLLFGKERATYQYLPNTHKDVFTMECEIVELKEKPSLPWGTIGVDSYGNKPTFKDLGDNRIKAICALGKQDFDLETSTPLDEDIIMLGCSSDHLMLDVTDCKRKYKVGDIIQLQLGYYATMRAFTSEYVEKVYL